MPAPDAEPPEQPAAAPDAEPPEQPAAAPDAEPPEQRAAAPATGMSRGYARSRERDEAVRAGLEPLAPGERPLGIKLAVALALLVAAANLVLALAGAGGESPAAGFAFALLMVAVAAGLWARKYVVLLIFQALLALSMVVSTLSLAFASNLLGALLSLTVIALCAPVFWLLIRVMARLQVPPA